MPDHPLTFNDLIQTDNDGLMDCGATITACGLAFAAGRGTAFEIARMLLDGFDGDPRHRALREFVNDGYLDGLDPTSPNGNILLALHHVDADDWRVVWNMGGVANLLAERDALEAELETLRSIRPMTPAPVSEELRAAIAAAGPGHVTYAEGAPVPMVTPVAAGTIQERLLALKAEGLTFGACITAFGVDRDTDPFAKVAFENYQDEGSTEIDDFTVLSKSKDGAYVMAWVWVSNEEAGIPSDEEEEEEDEEDSDEDDE